MRFGFYEFKKTAAAILTASILATFFAEMPIRAPKAEAQIGVGAEAVIEVGPSAGFISSISATALISKAIDTVIAQATDLIVQKEYVYDAIAKQTAKILIRELSHSIITWIQNGFDGRPLFIEDPARFFENAGDIASGVFLQNIFGQDAQLLCEPFRLSIQISLFSVTHEALPTCTVSKIIANVQQMYENFSVGGWQSLISISSNVNNNAFGQILVTWDGLAAAITKKVADTRGKVLLDKGFDVPGVCTGGWKKRIAGTKTIITQAEKEQEAARRGLPTPSVPTPGQAEIEAVGFGDTSASPELVCERWGRGTPGAAIESSLINVFGETFQDLGVADEINEIISALINQGITYLTTIGSPKGVFGGGSAKPPFSASTPQATSPTNPLEGKLEDALK
ncbi:MAG: hypothetical protein HYW09_01245 [Candidatus Niyogibacteria bacterium]|nr:hypothetical protein [Candidatus Niyogibacteria bacterium]